MNTENGSIFSRELKEVLTKFPELTIDLVYKRNQMEISHSKNGLQVHMVFQSLEISIIGIEMSTGVKRMISDVLLLP